MTKILPFPKPPHGPDEVIARASIEEEAGIDLDRVARELSRRQAEMLERLRQAAIRAVEEEMRIIRAERKKDAT